MKTSLNAWFHEVQRAVWENSAAVKRSYATASVVSADRVVFNIKGNDYRLMRDRLSKADRVHQVDRLPRGL